VAGIDTRASSRGQSACWSKAPCRGTCGTRSHRSTRTTSRQFHAQQRGRGSLQGDGREREPQPGDHPDGQARSWPRIENRISDQGQITGGFTQQEVQDLSLVLRSGALPASMTYLEERTIGPTLGADSIRSGIMASLVGLTLVVSFMLFYYRLSGINAIVALSFNLIILLGAMSYVGATMTLPGIAGFILTMGMGVDSNVLVFNGSRRNWRPSGRPA
jgi:protein-export SecD/SecF family membrane protein